MDSEGGVHFKRQGLPSPRSLISVKASALLCSLNTLALPAQDEPTCICGRGCLVKRRLLLQSCRMTMWRRTVRRRLELYRHAQLTPGPQRGRGVRNDAARQYRRYTGGSESAQTLNI